MLEPLDDGLWVATTPHVMMGLHLGTRMTVARLRDDSLFVSSPIVLDARLAAEIDELGRVLTPANTTDVSSPEGR